ncbi:hypothetical protein FFF34_012570 [Inquilinus sp. KBS0705]|nr:hypothetical protein FFF34_012570 [Inquilinus sp. KBS0705]
MADLQLLENIQQFDSCIILNFKQKEPVVQDFAQVTAELNNVRAMINEMIEIIETREDLAGGYTTAVNKYITDFNEKANSLILYKVDGGNSSNYNNNIISDINSWIQIIYLGYNDNKPYGFMALYNALKLNQLVYLQKNRSIIEQIKAEVRQSRNKATELFNLLQPQVNPLAPDPALIRNRILNNMQSQKKESGFMASILQFFITVFIFVFIAYFLWICFY